MGCMVTQVITLSESGMTRTSHGMEPHTTTVAGTEDRFVKTKLVTQTGTPMRQTLISLVMALKTVCVSPKIRNGTIVTINLIMLISVKNQLPKDHGLWNGWIFSDFMHDY